MFGVIDFSTKYHDKFMIALYSDIASAIAFFHELNQDNIVLPCVGPLLQHQNFLYPITDIQHLPNGSLLNIGIKRVDDHCTVGSVLMQVDVDDISTEYYEIIQVIYSEVHCGLCDKDFMIYDPSRNSGYYGCVYNPIYYKVTPSTTLQASWFCRHKLPEKLKKLDFENIFGVDVLGGLNGEKIAKFPLPDNYYMGMIICPDCMTPMLNKFSDIWSH